MRPRLDAGTAVRLLEGGGERAELELVASEIGRLLADGMAAEEIAVLVRTPGMALDLLEEVFSAAECRLRCSGAGRSGTRRSVGRCWDCCVACRRRMGEQR